MKRRLGSGRISPPAGFEPATPWTEVGSANRSATRTLRIMGQVIYIGTHVDGDNNNNNNNDKDFISRGKHN